MTQTIGQIIRRLRKERNFTQEELAEQLNVSAQAVSKWENGTSLPDISQVVPIAKVFGVSTDVLFGTFDTNDEEEVWKIVHKARSYIAHPLTLEMLRRQYETLQEGLKTYPNNPILLMQCLESGLSLAYPENGEVYDSENGRAIYEECGRLANLVISYSKNSTDVLRAHMIMVLLHSAYGNFSQARGHAEAFPARSDMTLHQMNAIISHFEKNYTNEIFYRRWDMFYHIESMLNTATQLALAHDQNGEADAALAVYRKIFDLIAVIFDSDKVPSMLHKREWGDIHALMAKAYLKCGNTEQALGCLEKMVEFDTGLKEKLQSNPQFSSPLLGDAKEFYPTPERFLKFNKKLLQSKLHDPAFDLLTSDERFLRLLERADAMKDG